MHVVFAAFPCQLAGQQKSCGEWSLFLNAARLEGGQLAGTPAEVPITAPVNAEQPRTPPAPTGSTTASRKKPFSSPVTAEKRDCVYKCPSISTSTPTKRNWDDLYSVEAPSPKEPPTLPGTGHMASAKLLQQLPPR